MPAQQAAISGDLIKEIWFYVRSSERAPGDGALENEGNDFAMELKQDLTAELKTIDLNIAAIQAKFPGTVANMVSDKPFQMSQMTLDGIEIIESIGIEF